VWGDREKKEKQKPRSGGQPVVIEWLSDHSMPSLEGHH